MVYKEHLIELWINGNKVELEDQKSVNMRFNNVLFDPTKISSNQAEYSFEFEIPATKKNNIILDYANNLSKLNKFHQRYNAEVYADGTVIFSGTITINGFKEGKYSVNLVSVKVYSLEEIFGEMAMSEIKNWKIDFSGATTINARNAMSNTDVTFPLVSYGVFEKDPEERNDIKNKYTSKFDLDQWNAWYVESFPPSHNMLATIKKCFESVESPNGNNYVVGGDVFEDDFLRNIYMSTNLADGQTPTYNLGNPLFGSTSLYTSWQTPTSGTSYTQTLKFPYWRAGGLYSAEDHNITGSSWNFSSIQVYDLLSPNDGGNYQMMSNSYMFHPDNTTIVIPADGWYKIYLDATATFSPSQSAFTANQYCVQNLEWVEDDVTIPADFKTAMPFEIQLVKNYDDNIELIKGKNVYYPRYGYPAEDTKWGSPNRMNVTTCFPHEKLGTNFAAAGWLDYSTSIPTEINGLGNNNAAVVLINPDEKDSSIYTYDCTLGYVYRDDMPMMYDQAVSPAFICGFTSLGNDNGGGCAAIMKDGRSWSNTNVNLNNAMYNQVGYDMATTPIGYTSTNWDDITTTHTTYHENSYIDAPNCSFNQRESAQDFSGNVYKQQSFMGSIYCMVYLNKNDKLKLFGIQREYTTNSGTQLKYSVAVTANLKIEAASPHTRLDLERKNFGYMSESEFDKQLNLANFFNKEKKISDWIQNVVDAFNFEVVQNGNTIEFNKKRNLNLGSIAAVDIDNRANSADAESKMIDYPKSMAVKYKIDTDEWGFERSAVESQGGDEGVLDNDDWKKYGDSGYSIVKLNDDSFVTSTNDKSLQYSYTWYQNFNWYAVDSSFNKTSDNAVVIKIPCISKYSYMIDGYDYEESAKHDGFGLAQRFWIKPQATNSYVWLRTYPHESITLYRPINSYPNEDFPEIYLSYKNTESSLLTNFFNINAYLASNYVELDVYLTPDEYNRIKSGSLVHFDSDLYYPVEISGYDPSGYNPTTLKIMKKVN